MARTTTRILGPSFAGALLAVGALALASCGASGAGAPGTGTFDASGDGGRAEGGAIGSADAAAPAALGARLLAVADLARGPRTEGLSAGALSADARTLTLLADHRRALTIVSVGEGFSSFDVTGEQPLAAPPGDDWDAEGLVAEEDGWLVVTSETKAELGRFGRDGSFRGRVTLPARLAEQPSAAANKGVESLARSPSGRVLFAAVESALVGDGPAASKDAGTIVRVVRRELDGAGRETQHAYRTEPLGPGSRGDMGVSDVAALDDDTLLVLERGYQADYGNTVRLYRARLAGAPDVSAVAALGDAPGEGTLVAKELVVDLVALPAPAGLTHPGRQESPLLDNYETVLAGPTLPSGERVVLLVADDNARADQVPRVLVLAVTGL